MRPPSFWWREASLAATLLTPFAALYGAVAARRLAAPGRDVGIPIICVGNLDLGGAGKTPTALAVGELLQAAGATPFFLSRGYGGSLAGPVRVEPARHTAAMVGDEPLLLARLAPTVVARDRVLGANFARARGASVVVMDDGFQNPSLTKNLSILVVDGTRGIGNGRVFPAGPLRAPLQAQLARAHAILVIGEEGRGEEGRTVASIRDAARGGGFRFSRAGSRPTGPTSPPLPADGCWRLRGSATRRNSLPRWQRPGSNLRCDEASPITTPIRVAKPGAWSRRPIAAVSRW